ncbi:formate C-acetyltransferase [Noviherbaspirillum sp.]|uniref:formate C-acetyltransferase n=1 Tax=Noviherbaspirillum sp. TaxID=1926288 RepID=UPI0032C224C8
MNMLFDAAVIEKAAAVDKAAAAATNPWRGFRGENWRGDVAVRDFINQNYTEYRGDDRFLTGPTGRTRKQMSVFDDLLAQERRNGGVLSVSGDVGSSITAHGPGYIDRASEAVVGLQTDEPLRRAIFPQGGLHMVEQSLKEYGFGKVDPKIEEIYTLYRKDHNNGVFDAYPADVLAARHYGLLTGLPDAYGRGRLIGCFRRVALYGVDRLVELKKNDKAKLDDVAFSDEVIRTREELSEQIRALQDLKQMAAAYGFDISRPAANAREAVQWLYFAYLGAAKQSNGAATSVGRISTFLDVYIQRDLEEGTLTEEEAQELIDHLVIKFRAVRYLRTPGFDALFSGDPTWVTLTIAGMSDDGRSLVSKTCFRVLQTLYNLGNSPEPNLTVLWSTRLPQGFKDFSARVAIDTSAIQVESDDAIRPGHGDDAAISCCVSPMANGRAMQFFGARCNLLKTLLYAINGGRDEVSGALVAKDMEPVTGDYLDFDDVKARFEKMMEYTARIYIKALNAIHYMHDKYAYEALQFALLDTDHYKTLACGIAGLSHVADSLSAIRYGKIRVLRNEAGVAVDFVNEGAEFPCYGNNDDRVDEIAVWAVRTFMAKLREHRAYKDAVITQSALTITSNVVYGSATGNSPDCAGPGGRRAGQPFAPGANPSNGQDRNGCVAAGFSVAKIPFDDCGDGISWTFSMVPSSLGKTADDRIGNLGGFIDGFVEQGGYHLNINVMTKETLLDAMEHGAEKYPNLCVRVSGYCVLFHRLTRQQQEDVLSRTFHERA